jgi:hypothetical protein
MIVGDAIRRLDLGQTLRRWEKSMRILWTLFKIIIGLAIAIPLGIMALALTAGVLGTLFGLAVLVLKLACVALVGYGVFRVARAMFVPNRKPAPPPIPELRSVDPYYEAAMRELDSEIERRPRS